MKRAALVVAAIVLSVTPCAVRGADGVPAQGPAGTPAPAAVKFTVQVLGRVKNPGDVHLESGARLSDALTAAGAVFDTLLALTPGPLVRDTECTLGGPGLPWVFLTRPSATPKTASYIIDIARALRDHDLRYDPLLRDNDRIFVPECRPKSRMIPTPPTFPNSNV